MTNIDELSYGTPLRGQLDYLKEGSYLDSCFADLTQFTFPKNSADATKDELKVILQHIQQLIKTKEENLKRYQLYDVKMAKFYINYLCENGLKEKVEEITDIVKGIIEDTTPLAYKLKYFFQRPRPYQLAQYNKLLLFPFCTTSSPSFPSKHAFQSKVLSEVLGNTYPQLYKPLKNLHDDICDSRLSLGVSYSSDIDVGEYVGETVLGIHEFKIKFKL